MTFAPLIAVVVSVLSLIGAIVGWLLMDAREKTRASIVGEQVAQLTANDRANVEKIATLETNIVHAREENRRLDRDKADRTVIESMREMLSSISSRLDRIDDKIDHLRDRERGQ